MILKETGCWKGIYDYLNGCWKLFSSVKAGKRSQNSPRGLSLSKAALSIWLNVDPMSDKYTGLSPYTYCANNPVVLKDPNGEEIIENNIENTKSVPDDPPKANQNFKETLKNIENKTNEIGYAFVKGLASSLPILSTVNDIHILAKDENMFGDKATRADKVWAKIGVSTIGAGSLVRGVGKFGVKLFQNADKIFDGIDIGLGVRSEFINIPFL